MSRETYMIESLTRELITRLMEEKGLALRDAMDLVYRSRTYTALCNLDTGLYFQSEAYVYEDLMNELDQQDAFTPPTDSSNHAMVADDNIV